jgi:iron(III) transport system substrate-binding protein
MMMFYRQVFRKESTVRIALLFALGFLLLGHSLFAASPGPALEKAKKDAEAKGYVFFSNRDEIIAKAKKEVKLRVLANLEPPNIKATTPAFIKRYPFIDLYVEEAQGTEQMQRRFLAIQSGMAKEWDIIPVSSDLYSQHLPYLWKVDVFAMASHQVLAIPPQMIDPKSRNVMALFTRFQVTAYNKQMLPSAQVPKTWEDFLKPEFKGRKFAADVRPQEIAGLVPAWGLEKTVEFARRLAAQQPIWIRGASRTLTAMMAGEIPLLIGPNFHTVKRAQSKDRAGRLEYILLEPVPLRLVPNVAVQLGAQHPHAGLLWLEWMASPEAQQLADEHEPLASSVYVRGGVVEKELKGKKLSVSTWDDQSKIEEWQGKIVDAYGFPKAEMK